MKYQKGILVTGSHRSGSTWLGKIIGQHSNVGYIHEPFNVNYYPSQAGRCAHHFKHWFTYISEANEDIYYEHLNDTFKFKYSFNRAVKRLKQLENKNYHQHYIEYLKVIKGEIVSNKNCFLKLRPLVKDPISLFSSEWISSKFDMDVVILIRHPLAFTGSLKVKKWSFPFSDFLEQPLLMEKYLYPFESEIQNLAIKNDCDIIEQSCLLWRIIHSVILKFKEKHPNWMFVYHEDISRDALNSFEEIFRYLNLSYPKSIRNKIIKYTSSNNAEINNQNKGASRIMNSKNNVKSWKNRLTDSEIKKVRAAVEDISSHFYSDSDWL